VSEHIEKVIDSCHVKLLKAATLAVVRCFAPADFGAGKLENDRLLNAWLSESSHWRECSEFALSLRFFDAGLSAAFRLVTTAARVGKHD
jgi:hypothetical protein